MAREVSSIRVCLRLVSEAIDPDEITRAVGIAPTRSHREGDPVTNSGQGQRRTSAWLLESEVPESASLEEHLRTLLDRVDAVEATRRFKEHGWRPDLFCGCFLQDQNENITLTPETLGRIAFLGATLSLDIYSADEPEEPDGPDAPDVPGTTQT